MIFTETEHHQRNQKDSIETTLFERERLPLYQEDRGYGEIIDDDWVLLWHETFEYLDKNKWNVIEQGDNYNHELQYYLPQNVQIVDSTLEISAKEEMYKSHNYTSGKLTTQDKFTIEYGKIEVTLRVSHADGTFPAVWLLPESGDTLPEVDIYESIGRYPAAVYYVNHWIEDNKQKRSYASHHLEDPYASHTYAIEWSKDEIKWLIDGEHIFTSTEGIPHEPMYLVINLAIGGTWAKDPSEDTLFPLSMIVEEVKFMKRRD